MQPIKIRIIEDGEIVAYEMCDEYNWHWSEPLRAQEGRWKYPNAYDNNVDPVIRNLFTGFLDRNGQEIYEGDIIENSTGKNRFVIEWERGAFVRRTLILEGLDDIGKLLDPVWTLHASDGLENVKVIGNRYLNPELMEVNR